VGGFSSGAGLALWLGLTNGDLFTAFVPLSGGGLLPTERVRRPHMVIAHGTEDHVIPIDQGGDPIARSLQADGYDVTYRRFRGGHRVIPAIARMSVIDALYR
jgi:predicted esterase